MLLVGRKIREHTVAATPLLRDGGGIEDGMDRRYIYLSITGRRIDGEVDGHWRGGGGYSAAEHKRSQWLMGWIGLLTLLPLIARGNEWRKHTDDNFLKQGGFPLYKSIQPPRDRVVIPLTVLFNNK